MSSSTNTLEALLQRNRIRQAAFLERPFMNLVHDGSLENPRKREVFLACVRRFSINFQTLIFARQALCADPRFADVFLVHLREEIGHDALLAQQDMPAPVNDTLFEAILGWFNYQMIVLDNVEKAALMHLVLETAGDSFHTLAAPSLRDKVDSPYFDAHSELDADHAKLATKLLEGLSEHTYHRLCLTVERGWDMMDAITERTRQLVLETS
jgi:hypothetical protein